MTYTASTLRAMTIVFALCTSGAKAGTIAVTYAGTAVGYGVTQPFSLAFQTNTNGRREHGASPDGNMFNSIDDSTSAILVVGSDTYNFPVGPNATSAISSALVLHDTVYHGPPYSHAAQSVGISSDDGTTTTTGLVHAEIFGVLDDLYAFARLTHAQSLALTNVDGAGLIDTPHVLCASGAWCIDGDAGFEYIQTRDSDGGILQSVTADLYARTATFAVTGAVPEPASWALLVAGFGLVGIVTRRQGIAVGA